MVRYSFLVGLFHPRLHAGLSRRLRSLTVAAQKRRSEPRASASGIQDTENHLARGLLLAAHILFVQPRLLIAQRDFLAVDKQMLD
jgi:hypothetical protein